MSAGQRGADWKSGGELKALHRIIPPVDGEAEADDALPPRTHNGPPAAVYNVSNENVELEAQALAVEKALAESVEADKAAESKRVRVGRELLRLQQIFMANAEMQRQKIFELRDNGMTFNEIAVVLGCSRPNAQSAYRKRHDPHTTRTFRSTIQARQFAHWAANRFGITRKSVSKYIGYGRRGEVELKRNADRDASQRTRNNALARLVKAEEAKKMAPAVFKKAFMALQPPARKATLLWACSMLVGSEDPQEIARWFAAALRSTAQAAPHVVGPQAQTSAIAGR